MEEFKNYYIILDRARIGSQLDDWLVPDNAYISLFDGTGSEQLSAVAPYLFKLTPNLLTWFKSKGADDNWGIIFFSPSSLQELKEHFSFFLLEKDENGKEVYFRYYDPRVFRNFITLLDNKQLSKFFGTVEFFVCESSQVGFLYKYFVYNSKLEIKELGSSSFFDYLLGVPPTLDKAYSTELKISDSSAPSEEIQTKSKWKFS